MNRLLGLYRNELATFSIEDRLLRLPRFEVLELLRDDSNLLMGFSVHMSNGQVASFRRFPDRTECPNVIPRRPLNFFAGNLDALVPDWRGHGQRVYQAGGISGRYNPRREWRPLLYPGEVATLHRDAQAASDDPRVSGALFYMMCTGHRGIEFVARLPAQLPQDYLGMGGVLHLWRCQPDLASRAAFAGWR